MTTRTEVITALDSYADTVYTAAKAEQKALDQITIDNLNAKIVDLQAQIDALTAPEVIEFSNFATQWSGIFLDAKSLLGKGVGKTTYQMKPLTSTKADAVNALTSGQSNLCLLIRSGGLDSSHIYSGIEIAGFTLRGTNQGHNYGGLNVGYSTGAYLHDLKITGIPGSSSSPPGETFALGAWHANNYRYEDIVLDGRDDAGVQVSASLLGINSVVTGVTRRLKSNYARYGFGAAVWDSRDLAFIDCDFRFNRKAINIEESRGGYYTFTRCDFRGTTGAAYIAQVSSTKASSKVTFNDCTFDNDLCKVLTYPGQTNGKQLDSDIKRFINGVDVTPDATKFQIVHP